jgi:hypothetical protein
MACTGWSMQTRKYVGIPFLLATTILSAAKAQTPPNLAALLGLAPVSALQTTAAGRAALAANLTITGAIQNGTAHQPTLLPFPQQQEQALRDAFITGGNAFELADGLGSTIGAIYQSATSYTSADDGKTSSFTNLSPEVAQLIAYASATERSDSSVAKFFFANATLDGKAPASTAALGILTAIDGTMDIFGKAYSSLAGSMGANRYGNSRPFQTEPHLLAFEGKDFFGVASGNIAYLRGPAQDLTDSPSYPSGHTTYGYTETLLLGFLVPERYPQMVVRAAEYANDRIIIGAHYAMDVLGGRTLAEYDLAQLLANKPGYVGAKRHGLVIEDFPQALAEAQAGLARALASRCGDKGAACVQRDSSRFADPAKNRIFYNATQTYGLPVIFTQTAVGTEDVGKLAPEAGYLLTAVFPYLSLVQADAILTATEGPGGGFLDNGSAFGVYSRLDLYRASEQALAAAPSPQTSVDR